MKEKTLKIGSSTIAGLAQLSPMAGFSDSPYRFLTRRMGSAFSYTEFVSADSISHYSKKAIDLFRFRSAERPIAFQIFGNNLEVLTEAARIIEDLEPDWIDLNMGCSTRKVSQRGSGAGLLQNPSYAGKIIESMNKAVRVPVTAKIRLGWDSDSLNYLEVTRILEESGASAISVHGRTKEMRYSGQADWEAIAEIKANRKVPIFGNGDVLSYSQAKNLQAKTNVDLVLIGRAAIGNPWIFSGRDKADVPQNEKLEVAWNHLQDMCDFYGEINGLRLFRKHLSQYFDSNSSWKKRLLVTESLSEFQDIFWSSEKSESEQREAVLI